MVKFKAGISTLTGMRRRTRDTVTIMETTTNINSHTTKISGHTTKITAGILTIHLTIRSRGSITITEGMDADVGAVIIKIVTLQTLPVLDDKIRLTLLRLNKELLVNYILK